jgi:PIN domain nuclease of toxin-antitoxin system
VSYLLDTHVLVGVLENKPGANGAVVESILLRPRSAFSVSVASFWEIAIKYRLGKLQIAFNPLTMPEECRVRNIGVLPVTDRHALTTVEPLPPTRDPFDRLLLAVCAVEDMRLVTADGALAGHPLAAF